VVPLLKVEWLRKPFEGVIAMCDTCFEPEAETADASCCGDRARASTFPLLTRNRGRDFRRDGGRGERGDSAKQPASSVAIIEPERQPALRVTEAAAIFTGGEAPGRFGGSTSKRSS
jgi:hypothetical protein